MNRKFVLILTIQGIVMIGCLIFAFTKKSEIKEHKEKLEESEKMVKMLNQQLDFRKQENEAIEMALRRAYKELEEAQAAVNAIYKKSIR